MALPDLKSAPRRAGLFERAITRLLMRPAQISAVANLSENFRLIDFEGEALKNCAWSPATRYR